MKKLVRPELKLANVKVSEKEMAYFSLGIGSPDVQLPSEKMTWRTDARAVSLVRAIQNGEDVQGKDFSGVNLTKADLAGADLRGISFKGSVFLKTNLVGANLTGVDLSEAYLEDCDLSGADLTDVNWEKTYTRNLNIDGAILDEKARARLSAQAFLIEQLEKGLIDIRLLSQEDLHCLDLRRIDLSKIDLEGIDLSAFILEGVNLRGVHIDPKMLMSLEQLHHYHQFIQELNEKEIKLETLKFAKEKHLEMEKYHQKQQDELKQNKKLILKKKQKRPLEKIDEFKGDIPKSDEGNNEKTPKILKQKPKSIRATKAKNRS